MDITTNLLEEYVSFVDMAEKQNKYFKMITFFFLVFLCLFLFFVLSKYDTK